MNMEEYKEYRAEAMKKICTNQRIKDLLTNTTRSTIPPNDLIDSYVFPYEFIPGTSETVKTYITMLLSTPLVKNRSILKSRIVIYVFTHENLMWAIDPSDNKRRIRIDLLCEEISKMFNGSDDFGLKLQLASRKGGYHPMDKYHGDMLVFETADFNYKV